MAAEIRKDTLESLKENFYPAERIALFVDGANLAGTVKTLAGGDEEKWQIDYTLLRKAFGKCGRMIRAYYFTAVKGENQEYDGLRKLVDFMDSNGWTCVTKAVKYQGEHGSHYTMKGNMDVELTIAMLKMSNFVDHLVLFSGDGDFRALVEELQDRGKRVTVVATRQGNSPTLSADLRKQADNFVDLADLKSLVLRDAKERTRAMLDAGRAPS